MQTIKIFFKEVEKSTDLLSEEKKMYIATCYRAERTRILLSAIAQSTNFPSYSYSLMYEETYNISIKKARFRMKIPNAIDTIRSSSTNFIQSLMFCNDFGSECHDFCEQKYPL